MKTKQIPCLPYDRLEAAAHVLRALTHPHRLQICERLSRGKYSVGDLCEELGLKQNAVSQHLNHLRAYGLVRPQRDGRTVYYQVSHPAPLWLLECIAKHLGSCGS